MKKYKIHFSKPTPHTTTTTTTTKTTTSPSTGTLHLNAPLQARGSSPSRPPGQHHHNQEGNSEASEQRRSPQIAPTPPEPRAESIVYATPPPPQPHPAPLPPGGSRSPRTDAWPRAGPCRPFPARDGPGTPPPSTFGRSEDASWGRGTPVGAGDVSQGTGGSILISSISSSLLLRCLPGFLLSCCQLGSADRSELLPAPTNRKA